MKNAEIAQRTKDIPQALQHENTAPQEYFQHLVESFEERMQVYRKQIEVTESHLASLSQGQTLTPQGEALQQIGLVRTAAFQAITVMHVNEADNEHDKCQRYNSTSLLGP